jgi:hypothetical protein
MHPRLDLQIFRDPRPASSQYVVWDVERTILPVRIH